jgi:flagellar motor switch protein FliM
VSAHPDTAEKLDLIAGSMGRAALEETGFSEKRLVAALERLFSGYDAAAFRVGDPVRKAASESEWLALHAQALRCRCFLASGKTSAFVGVQYALFAALFDRYYGGDGQPASSAPEFTAAERSFARRLSEDLAKLPLQGWSEDKRVASGGFDLSFGDDQPMATRECGGLAIIDIPVGNTTAISIAITTECIASMRAHPAGAKQNGPRLSGEWRRQLLDRASDVRLPVRSVLARPEIPAARLMTLKPGDFLPLNIPKTVPLTVGKHLIAHGTMGEAQGCVAIRIESIAKGPKS